VTPTDAPARRVRSNTGAAGDGRACAAGGADSAPPGPLWATGLEAGVGDGITPGVAERNDARRMPLVGPAVAAALLAGTVLVFLAPTLPPAAVSALAAAAAALGWAFTRRRAAAAFAFGLAWTALHGQMALQQRLPDRLQGQDLAVVARVVGLPEQRSRSTRVDLRVLEADAASGLAGHRVRVSRYGAGPALEPGSTWAMTLRLRRPRGLANPGGFDFERFALERRIVATGYIRDGGSMRQLAPGVGVDLLRSRLSAAIASILERPSQRFLQALAVADTRALSDEDWEVLRTTGITHLIAISGLHVGLVAGFAALLARLAYLLRPRLGLRLPLPQAAALCALAGAAGYTALAGFGLPTVRTLAMIAAALLAVLVRRCGGPWQAFALALVALLLLDPLAALSPGFWLSFLGVAWLLWCLPRGDRNGALRQLGRAQWAMTLGLLPLTVWFFGQASVAGPLVNLVAVPWVSFVVVPLTLLGCALAWLPALAVLPLTAAAWAMELLWMPLEPLAQVRGALAWLPEPSLPALLLSLAGALWLLLPRGVPGKPLAWLLLLPLLAPQLPRPEHGGAELVVIDVGQGLAVLVRTRTHALLYDAGPAHGDVDLGDAVVVPTLRARGIRALDLLLVSHGDNDHAGGVGAVRRAYAPPRVLAGEPGRSGVASACTAGQAWNWDGVRFDVLHPPRHFPELGNESSCVLRIRTRRHRALLTGDISSVIESRLADANPHALRSDVLLVAHHGSGSSSSEGFLAAAGAPLALVSVAHRSRFGHPAADTVARLVAAGSVLVSTADAGALTLQLGGDAAPVPQGYRQLQRRFWRER